MPDAVQWVTIKPAIQKWIVEGSGLPAESVVYERQYVSRPVAPCIEISLIDVEQPAHDWVRRARNPLLGQGPASSTTISAVVGSQLEAAAPHSFVTADGPVGVVGPDVPTPLDVDADYWLVVDSATRVRLCATYQDTGGNNVARGMGTTPNPITTIALTDAGSGSLAIVLRAKAARAGNEVKRTAAGLRAVTLRMTAFGVEGGAFDAVVHLTNILASLPLHVYELDQAGVGMATLGTADVESKIRGIPGKLGTAQEPRAIVEFVVYVGSEVVGYETTIQRVTVTPVATSTGGDDITLPPLTVDLPY